MTDTDSTATAPSSEDPVSTPPPKQAEDKMMLPSASPPARTLNLGIWPPSQRTRDAVIARLIETLSTPSVLSKRYGTIPHDEAADAARRIEEEAFGASTDSTSPDDDGLEILQQYSKEISKRMLETVKARAASNDIAPSTPPLDVPRPADSAADEAPASDEAAA